MNLLSNLFVIIFYILFFSWIFLKVKNVILVKKLNCKQNYKQIKKDIKRKKLPKYLFIISLIAIILFVIYLGNGIINGILAIFFMFITLGDPTYYNNFIENSQNYFNYVEYCYYFILYILLVRAIYINVLIYKILISTDPLDNNDKQSLYNGQQSQNSASFNNQYNKNIKKDLLLLIGIVVVVIMFIVGFSFIINNIISKKSTDLKDVISPSMNISVVMTPSWYFFYQDKMYVYDDYADNGELGDHLYSTDLSANNKEILACSEDLRYADIFMTYKGEMFYYTEYNRGIKKLNLTTGKISNVIDDKYLYLIPDTLKDGKVLVNYTDNYLGGARTYFYNLDLETGTLSNEKKINFESNQPYFYCKDNNKVYYIKESSDNENSIYEDNKVIYTYEADNNLIGWKSNPNSNISDLVFVQDDYIFAIIANKILKFDLKDYSIIEEKELDKSFNLISCVREGKTLSLGLRAGPAATSLYPLFTIVDKESSYDSITKNGDIYKFNSNNLTFEKIIDKNAEGGFLQKYGEYFILQTDSKTVIYNDNTNKYKIYNSTNYSVEDNYIYLMTYTGDLYHQADDNFNIEIQKISFDEIFN